MRSVIYFVAVTIMMSGCQSTTKPEGGSADTTDISNQTNQAALNDLSESQRSEGWRVLFNGKDLDGLRFFKNRDNNSWEVTDGSLHAKASAPGSEKRADLVTEETYTNFELMFDWKVPAAGNSGVMFRVTEDNDAPYLSGPEYQIIDDKGWPGDPLKDTQLSGSNYDMHAAPANKRLNATGEWNSSKIVVNGNHVEHWLNGQKLFSYELASREWEDLKARSKWKNVKSYGAASSGLIAFQDHGQEIWFRNIFIKPL